MAESASPADAGLNALMARLRSGAPGGSPGLLALLVVLVAISRIFVHA